MTMTPRASPRGAPGPSRRASRGRSRRSPRGAAGVRGVGRRGALGGGIRGGDDRRTGGAGASRRRRRTRRGGRSCSGSGSGRRRRSPSPPRGGSRDTARASPSRSRGRGPARPRESTRTRVRWGGVAWWQLAQALDPARVRAARPVLVADRAGEALVVGGHVPGVVEGVGPAVHVAVAVGAGGRPVQGDVAVVAGGARGLAPEAPLVGGVGEEDEASLTPAVDEDGVLEEAAAGDGFRHRRRHGGGDDLEDVTLPVRPGVTSTAALRGGWMGRAALRRRLSTWPSTRVMPTTTPQITARAARCPPRATGSRCTGSSPGPSRPG